MKNKIITLAKSNLVDEIRFIDAQPLTDAFVGNPGLFKGRQPQDILPAAKTVIMVSIYIGKFASPPAGEYGRMSRLVLSGFYTNIVRPLLPIKEYLESQGYQALVMDGSTEDSAIPIKGAAVKAGLGWIGKHTLLINEWYGSFQALGAILTDADLSENYTPAENRCGTCTKCMDTCPGQAIQQPRQLTRPKCLSHILDGEEDGQWSLDQVDLQGYFFECDLCQEVCPWNERHTSHPLETPYGQLYEGEKIRPILKADHLLAMDEETFETQLTPYMGDFKLPYPVFKRNVQTLKRTCPCAP